MIDRERYRSTIGALATSVFDALSAVGFAITSVNDAIVMIPLAEAGFAWILPAAVGRLAGVVAARIRRGA